MKNLKPRTTTPKLIDNAALRIGLAYALTTVHHIYGGPSRTRNRGFSTIVRVSPP